MTCQHCGGHMPDDIFAAARVYCSQQCTTAANNTRNNQTRPASGYKPKVCLRCGATYQPTGATQKWCTTCPPVKPTRPPLRCDHCGTEFTPTNTRQRFCCSACANRAAAADRRDRADGITPRRHLAVVGPVVTTEAPLPPVVCPSCTGPLTDAPPAPHMTSSRSVERSGAWCGRCRQGWTVTVTLVPFHTDHRRVVAEMKRWS